MRSAAERYVSPGVGDSSSWFGPVIPFLVVVGDVLSKSSSKRGLAERSARTGTLVHRSAPPVRQRHSGCASGDEGGAVHASVPAASSECCRSRTFPATGVSSRRTSEQAVFEPANHSFGVGPPRQALSSPFPPSRCGSHLASRLMSGKPQSILQVCPKYAVLGGNLFACNSNC
jgi:hypothetical protein